MKILILADPASTHTSKWVNSLSEAGIKVLLFGMSKYDKDLYSNNIDIEILNKFSVIKGKESGSYLKLLVIISTGSNISLLSEKKENMNLTLKSKL